MEEMTDEQKKLKADQEAQTAVLRARAVRQAMFEVLGEHREEVIKRAAAKLAALGLTVEPGDVQL